LANQTPIHGFDLPIVGADSDAWGGFLNDNWSALDTLLAVDITATFLPVAGGTMVGQITLAGGGSGLEAATVDQVDAVQVNVGIVAGDLATHEADVANPHVVTAAQLSVLPLAGGTMTGQIELPGGGSGLEAATVGELDTGLALKAPTASPAFTGNPTAPTPSAGDNDTSVATTEFVKDAIGDIEVLVTKTADETVNNSTLLQDDNDLVFAMAANTTYVVNTVLLLNAAGDNTPDWKFGWTVPAGCTMLWQSEGSSAWGAGTSVTVGMELLTESQIDTAGSDVADHGAAHRAIVRNGANAGNLQLQWAQNTADASDSKVLKHSHMTVRNLGAT